MKTWVNLNHGRWCVPCPACNSSFHGDGRQIGVLTLEWGQPSFVCSECHIGPIDVVWPESRAAIEEVMAPRPIVNRNWLPGESLDRLRAENAGYLAGGQAL